MFDKGTTEAPVLLEAEVSLVLLEAEVSLVLLEAVKFVELSVLFVEFKASSAGTTVVFEVGITTTIFGTAEGLVYFALMLDLAVAVFPY